MTESEWLACEDPHRMLSFLDGHNPKISDRKVRLSMCACARRVWRLLLDRRSRDAVETAERLADGIAGRIELECARDAVSELLTDPPGSPTRYAELMARDSLGSMSPDRVWHPAGGKDCPCPASLQADILRDIVGNPFRPIVLPKGPPVQCRRCEGDGWMPSDDGWGARDVCKVCEGKGVLHLFHPCPWLTPDVKRLAQAAYEDRPGDDGTLDPARLLVLSDALEEAGCPSSASSEVCKICQGKGEIKIGIGREPKRGWPPQSCPACKGTKVRGSPYPILDHLRSSTPHHRGCHVLDLILGKE